MSEEWRREKEEKQELKDGEGKRNKQEKSREQLCNVQVQDGGMEKVMRIKSADHGHIVDTVLDAEPAIFTRV